MSDPFTDPMVNGFYVTGPANKLGELVTAYYERVYASAASQIGALLSISTNRRVLRNPLMLNRYTLPLGIEPPDLWKMQNFVQLVSPYWVDTSRLYIPSSSTPTYGTFANFCTVNNIGGGSGFRRVTSYSGTGAPTVAGYGLMQTGDIFGWWIWKDLIDAFSAMRQTVVSPYTHQDAPGVYSVVEKKAYATSDAGYPTAWAGASFTPTTYSYPTSIGFPDAAYPMYMFGAYRYFAGVRPGEQFYGSYIAHGMEFKFLGTPVADLSAGVHPASPPNIQTYFAADPMSRPQSLFDQSLSGYAGALSASFYDPLNHPQGELNPGADTISSPSSFTLPAWPWTTPFSFTSDVWSHIGVDEIPDPYTWPGVPGDVSTAYAFGCQLRTVAILEWNFTNSN